MAAKIYDRVKVTSSTIGGTSFVLNSAVSGYRSFADVVPHAEQVHYVATFGADWETGIGTYDKVNNKLARTIIHASSNNNNTVNFSEGIKVIFISVTAGYFNQIAEETENAITEMNTVSGYIETIDGSGMTLVDGKLNINSVSSSRITVGSDSIDLATVSDSGTGLFVKISKDNYGRVTGTESVTSADIAAVFAPVNLGISKSLGVGTAASDIAGDIRASGNITAYYSSDSRLKENIYPIENPIEKVQALRGVTYDWKDDYLVSQGGEDGYFVRKHDVGVIAQEVETVLPELVAEREDGYKAVRYERIVSLLIEAVKDQQIQINKLKELISRN